MLGITRLAQEYLDVSESVLRQNCTTVVRGGDLWKKLPDISKHMFEILYSLDGAALAAPQVGLAARIVVADPSGIRFGPEVLINPQLSLLGDEFVMGEEGCLSLPLLKGRVNRAKRVHISYVRLDGTPCELNAEGWLARIFQHEVDHLNGVLYPDRMEANVELEKTAQSSVRRSEAAIDKVIANLSK